jgi:hypothetical protein
MAFSISQTASRTAGRTSTGSRTGSGTTSRKANIGLWTAQGGLALVFLFAGASKLVMPAADLGDSGAWVAFLRFIGACEALGAVGLVLPWLLNIRRGLTPLAASGLVIIMAGATVISAIDYGVAPATIPFIVGVLAAVVAVGRRNG